MTSMLKLIGYYYSRIALNRTMSNYKFARFATKTLEELSAEVKRLTKENNRLTEESNRLLHGSSLTHKEALDEVHRLYQENTSLKVDHAILKEKVCGFVSAAYEFAGGHTTNIKSSEEL